MINLVSSPGEYCFIGNPVVLEVESDTADPIKFTVESNSKSCDLVFYPYKHVNGYRVRTSIQDILSSFFDQDYSEQDTDQLISPISDLTMPYTVKINGEEKVKGLALRGGISKAAIKFLAKNNWDIFTYKILNTFGQFLFTTRTFQKVIPIRDTELYNFIFLHPGTSIVFTNENDVEIVTDTLPLYTPCSMNLAAIRNQFEIQHDVLPNIINVYVDGQLAFSFNIIPGTISENRYSIRFRNSFGTFEKIEVVGIANQKPQFTEENSFQAMTEYDFFEERRNRVGHVDTIEVETGYKTRSEHSFILDMIKSDEIYFNLENEVENRCHVTAPDMKFAQRIFTPSSVALIIRMVDEEKYIASGLDLEDLADSRIFTDNFDDPFN